LNSDWYPNIARQSSDSAGAIVVCVESLEDMRRQAARDHALRSREGVTRIPPTPVAVRVITGHAIAYTATQVLVEWEAYGDWHCRWEDNWQVKRV